MGNINNLFLMFYGKNLTNFYGNYRKSCGSGICKNNKSTIRKNLFSDPLISITASDIVFNFQKIQTNRITFEEVLKAKFLNYLKLKRCCKSSKKNPLIQNTEEKDKYSDIYKLEALNYPSVFFVSLDFFENFQSSYVENFDYLDSFYMSWIDELKIDVLNQGKTQRYELIATINFDIRLKHYDVDIKNIKARYGFRV